MVEIFTYAIFSVVFTSTIEFSKPISIGIDAQIFIYPKNAELGTEKISVNFILFTSETLENMKMSDTELLSYSKSTFLGTSKPAISFKERVILGKTSKGEVLSTKIPVVSNIEVHIVTLENGVKLCIGFKSVSEIPANDLENIISEICKSLKSK